MPFRSEAEPLREQIRRAEEQAEELLDERARLEQHVAEQKKSGGGLRAKLLVFATLAIISAATLVGFVAGDLAAEQRARTAAQHRDERVQQDLLGLVFAASDCSQLVGAKKSDLASCDRARATAKLQSTMPVEPRPGPRNPRAPGAGGLR